MPVDIVGDESLNAFDSDTVIIDKTNPITNNLEFQFLLLPDDDINLNPNGNGILVIYFLLNNL